jgi:hypothetical protein
MQENGPEPDELQRGEVIFMPEILFVGVKPGYYVVIEFREDRATLGFVDILDTGIAPTGRTINVPRDSLARFRPTTHTLDVSTYPYGWPPATSETEGEE